MKLKIVILTISFLFCASAFAQSKKNVKKNKVKSITVTKTFTRDGKEITLKDSYEKYDSDANLLEEITYNDSGQVTLHESFQYNKNGDVTEEIHYKDETKVKKK